MSKRYYLCDIIGSGTEEDMFRPAVADHPVDWVGSIETGPDGRPIHADTIVLVSTDDHSILRADRRIDPLPDFALDGKMSAINGVVKTAMTNAMKRRGFDVSGLTNTDGYRKALQQIGAQRSAGFDIDKFDVR